MGHGHLRDNEAYLSMVSLKLVMHRAACNVALPPNDEPGPPASAGGNTRRKDHIGDENLITETLLTCDRGKKKIRFTL
mgnify:CR=1 FL=1